MPVPGQETWVCACVHLVRQKTVINDSVSKLQTLKYQMQDISRYRHFNSFKNEDSLSLSLFYCHFLFETLSTYIPVVRVLRMASFSVSGISMPGTGCKCQNPYIARLQEDVDRLWKEKIFLQVKFWWTGHLTQSQYQNDSQCQASMPVPRQETWVCAYVHLVSQKTVIKDSVSKLWTSKYQCLI